MKKDAQGDGEWHAGGHHPFRERLRTDQSQSRQPQFGRCRHQHYRKRGHRNRGGNLARSDGALRDQDVLHGASP